MRKCKFVLHKETKGAWQYKQVEEDGAPVGEGNDDKTIGTIYLRKAKWDGREQVTVILEG